MALRYPLLVFDWNGTLFDVRHAGGFEQGHLYPEVPAVLTQLHALGYQFALATAASRASVLSVLQQSQLRQLFVAISSADDGYYKPDPKVLENVFDQTGFTKQDTLMIGDTLSDIALAHHAGVAALAVSYGLESKARLLSAKPLGCIDSIAELPEWLLSR